MAKPYGGKTGPLQNITTSSAPGAWTAGTEVFRQRTANLWPSAFPLYAVCPLGSVVFAATSGVVNQALSSTFFVVASGGVLNRTTEAPLFAAIGTTFGSGNGSTTFNVPNMYDKFIYLKGTTVSGTTPVQESGQLGALHVHTYNVTVGTPFQLGSPGDNGPDGTGSLAQNTEEVGEVSHVQNEQNKVSFIPLVCKQTTSWPVGTLMPLLWPSYNGANFPVSNYLICSGQAVNRTTYSGLYQLLGNHFGAGNGSTTFNVPDLRGLFLAGTRNIGQIQPSGYIATFEPSCFVRHKHTFTTGSLGPAQNPGRGVSPNNAATNAFAKAPASSAAGLLPNQSNAANISVIWVMPAVQV